MIAARTIAANTSYTECCFKKTVDTHINKPQIAVMMHTFFLCLPKVFELNTANSIHADLAGHWSECRLYAVILQGLYRNCRGEKSPV